MQKHLLRAMIVVQLLAVGGAVAQGTGGGSRGKPLNRRVVQRPIPQEEVSSPLDRAIDIDFPGGFLGDLIVQVEKILGEPLNVLASVGAQDVSLSAFSLRGCTVKDVFRFSTRLVLNQAHRIRLSDSDTILMLELFSAPAEVLLRSIDIRPLLQEYDIEDILTAISTGLDMGSRDKRWNVKYHQETGLLFISGQKTEIQQAFDIYESLDQSVRGREKEKEKERLRLHRQKQVDQEPIEETKRKAKSVLEANISKAAKLQLREQMLARQECQLNDRMNRLLDLETELARDRARLDGRLQLADEEESRQLRGAHEEETNQTH